MLYFLQHGLELGAMTRELERGTLLGVFSIDKFSEKFYLSGKFRIEKDRPLPGNGRWVASPQDEKEAADELKGGPMENGR